MSTAKRITPAFPPELERYIFEISAKNDREGLSQLVVVARRVQAWIEPIIYKNVTLWGRPQKTVEAFIFTLNSRPGSFFATHVKAICLVNSFLNFEDELRIMSVCTGARELACFLYHLCPGSETIPLGLRKLAAIFAKPCNRLVRNPNFAHPAFARVTHLQLNADGAFWTAWSGFQLLPCLTHLALNDWGGGPFVARALHNILSECRSLRLVVLLTCGDHVTRSEINPEQNWDLDDRRLVLLPYSGGLNSWDPWGQEMSSMWELAETMLVEAYRDLDLKSR